LQVGFASLLDPSARADPYPRYHSLRENGPIHIEEYGVWILSDHATCSAVLRDPRFSADYLRRTRRFREAVADAFPELGDLSGLQEGMRTTMFFIDPPDHTRLRGLVSKAFTPRVVEQLRPRVQQLVDALLDELESKSEVDLIGDFAYPLPVTVIAEMLGVPVDDPALFRQRSRAAASMLEPVRSLEVIQAAQEASAWFYELFQRLGAERRAQPRDDLLTGLVAAEDAGDKLTEIELVTTCILLLVAGHETTQNLIGNGMLALLRSRDQFDLLRAQPHLIKGAVEELLRYDSPVQLTSRVATEDITVGDVKFGREEQALTIIGGANRDPAEFPEPERLDVTRQDNHHLSFSAGAHFCLGAPLARLEAQVAFETLVRRYPNMQLVDPEPEWRDTITLRGLKKLPLTLRG
jgi:cytochrome P450